MMVIHLNSGEARNQLQELTRRIEHPRQVLAAGASAGRQTLQRHFTDKDRVGNKLGGRRTHFWQDVMRSTQLGEITDRTADIEIGDFRFPQRLYGGTITAKTPWRGSGLRLLTIPVDPRAHGRRASVFKRETGLQLIFLGNASGGELLAHEAGAQDLTVIYICQPSVTQKPDPTALPDREQLERDIIEAAQEELTEQARDIQPQGNS